MSCTCVSCIRTRTNFFASTCARRRGGYRIQEEDHPKKMPLQHSATVAARRTCGNPHRQVLPADLSTATAETGIRRILGVFSLMKKYGTAAVEDACATALDIGMP